MHIHPEVPDNTLLITCDTCAMRNTDACSDCLVTALCGEPEPEAVIFDYEELRTLAVLAKAGLVPSWRHRGSA